MGTVVKRKVFQERRQGTQQYEPAMKRKGLGSLKKAKGRGAEGVT